METLLKIFVGFWIFFLFWYLTGGPLRDYKTHPFVGVNQNGEIEHYSRDNIPK